MGAPLKLESFGATAAPADDRAAADSLETLLAEARGAARAQGFEEGAAAAAAAYDSERRIALERIAEAVEDARLEAEEARRRAIDALRPVVEAFAAAVAPALARAGLAPEIAALVAEAARDCDPLEIEISVAPDMAEPAGEALEGAGVRARLRVDPALGPLEARAAWDGGFDRIDLAETLARAEGMVSAYFDSQKRTGTDG